MTNAVAQLVEQAKQLSEDDRADLIDVLVCGLDNPKWEEAWHAEAQRRWALHQANPSEAIPAEEVHAELRRKLGR